MQLRASFLLLATFLLSACTAGGPVFSGLPSQPPDKASVVLLRPHTPINSGGFPHVYIDDEKRGTLKDTGYLIYELKPGPHKIALNNPAMWDGKEEWEISPTSGERLYFAVVSGDYKFEYVASAWRTSKTVTVYKLDEASALRELKSLRLSQK